MGMFRSLQNVTRRYSPAQIKVRDATCNDGQEYPSPDDLFMVARYSFNGDQELRMILQLLERRLRDKGKNWLHVSKSLIVLNYLMVAGSPFVLDWTRDHIYHISSLGNFKYITSDGEDIGKKVREATDQCVRIFSKDKLRRELRQELVMLNPAIKELCQKRRVQEYEELQGRHELVGRREEERQQFPEDREHQFPQSRQMYGVQDSNTNERSPTPVSDLSSSEEDGELRYAIELSKAEAHALEVQRREQERIRREEDDAALESARQAYLDGNMRRKGINGPKDTMPSLLIDIQSDSTSTSTSSSATPRPVQAPIKAPIEAPISAPIPIASSNRAMETVQPHLVPWIQPRTPSSPSPLAQFSQQQQPHYQTSSPLWNQICAPMQTPRYQQQMNGMNYQTVNPLMYPKEADMSFQPLQYGRQAPPPPPPPRVELLRQQLTGWAAPPAPAATVSGNRNPFLSP